MSPKKVLSKPVPDARFFNRELSWMEFNFRVLEEALNKKNPLMERLKFLAIYSSNLDEFFMVRVSGLVSQRLSEYREKDVSGYTPNMAIEALKERIAEQVDLQYQCFRDVVAPGLEKNHIRLFNRENLPKAYKESLRRYFLEELQPILTPMAIDQGRPFPFLAGKQINILVKLKKKSSNTVVHALVPMPAVRRMIPIPERENEFIYLGEFIVLFLEELFKGSEILDHSIFRLTRDAELEFDEEEALDLLSTIEEELRKRERGQVIRLEIEKSSPSELKDFLLEHLKVPEEFIFDIDGPLDLTSFMGLYGKVQAEGLYDPPLEAVEAPWFKDLEDKSIFECIKQSDRFLHVPFQRFDPVVAFIDQAADDPDVLAIKMTLYRTSGDSPIIAALKRARRKGKEVAVLIELKARFDEAQNITWAKELEVSGCYVVYGLVGMKTHCKLALVVRKEERGIVRYSHMGTGNYNDKTAKLYTDTSVFSARPELGRDVSEVFNLLTGFSDPPRWRELICAPLDLRNFFIRKIDQEIANVKRRRKGLIVAKMNSLVDRGIIEKLYEASSAGVRVKLMVRGVCCLKAGVKGLSENIEVRSLVGRFLEHSRIFYFLNDNTHEYYMSSADWMNRNFDRRVEVLFPVKEEAIRQEVDEILRMYFKDNTHTRVQQSDGRYLRLNAGKNKKTYNVQYELMQRENRKVKSKPAEKKKIQFIPRKKPGDQRL